MELLDGKKIAAEIKEEVRIAVTEWVRAGNRVPHLAAILVGEDGASQTYVNAKVKACEAVGFDSSLIRLSASVAEEELLAAVDRLNEDDGVDGFIVQLPLPKHINETKVIERIVHHKDVDGFHPINVGRMALNLPAFISATPNGILEILRRYNIPTSGKHCVVLGRSNIVGSPMSILMSKKAEPGNATVTLCHSRTENLEEVCQSADILIVALGKPEFITGKFIKEGAVVIDVGITRVDDKSRARGYRLAGDVDFASVAEKCSYITPVPGGVGAVTVASLIQNTLKAARKEIYKT